LRDRRTAGLSLADTLRAVITACVALVVFVVAAGVLQAARTVRAVFAGGAFATVVTGLRGGGRGRFRGRVPLVRGGIAATRELRALRLSAFGTSQDALEVGRSVAVAQQQGIGSGQAVSGPGAKGSNAGGGIGAMAFRQQRRHLHVQMRIVAGIGQIAGGAEAIEVEQLVDDRTEIRRDERLAGSEQRGFRLAIVSSGVAVVVHASGLVEGVRLLVAGRAGGGEFGVQC